MPAAPRSLPGRPPLPPLPAPLASLTRSPLALRTLSSAVAVPVTVALILAGEEPVAALVALILVVAAYELATQLGIGARQPLLWLLLAGVAAMPAVALRDEIPVAWPLTVAVAAMIAALLLTEGRGSARGSARDSARAETTPTAAGANFRHIAAGIFTLLYVGWLGSHLVLLRTLPSGEEWLLLAVFAVMATDTGAFAAGRLLGRHRLLPQISPTKTVEGAVGGLFAGFSAVVLINLLPDLDVTYWKIALLGLILPLLAQIGDLSESAIKRSLGVKDFSRLIPGHGGVLDRLDSLLFGVPTVYFFVRWVVL